MKRLLAATALAVAMATGHGHDAKTHDAKTHGAKNLETPFGRAADPGKAKRTIQIEMTDQMRFEPSEISVKRGEIVRFVPVNKGTVMHEMVLGPLEDLKQHAELMKKRPGMAHDAPYMAHVPPGKSGEIGWQFTKAGEFFYGCLVAGHFDAGMIGKVTVKQ
jgi:uncharacterized cupredoxin-like copper-binding protein